MNCSSKVHFLLIIFFANSATYPNLKPRFVIQLSARVLKREHVVGQERASESFRTLKSTKKVSCRENCLKIVEIRHSTRIFPSKIAHKSSLIGFRWKYSIESRVALLIQVKFGGIKSVRAREEENHRAPTINS